MKRLNAISLILIFAVSLFVYSGSASVGISVDEQQSEKTGKLTK